MLAPPEAMRSTLHEHSTASQRRPPFLGRRDITVEFWARTPAYSARNSTPAAFSEFFSFAAYARDESESQVAVCVCVRACVPW